MNELLIIIKPVIVIGTVAAIAWWFLGASIGGERLIVSSLAIALVVAVLSAALRPSSFGIEFVASLMATFAIYGGWRLKHFLAERAEEREMNR